MTMEEKSWYKTQLLAAGGLSASTRGRRGATAPSLKFIQDQMGMSQVRLKPFFPHLFLTRRVLWAQFKQHFLLSEEGLGSPTTLHSPRPASQLLLQGRTAGRTSLPIGQSETSLTEIRQWCMDLLDVWSQDFNPQQLLMP